MSYNINVGSWWPVVDTSAIINKISESFQSPTTQFSIMGNATLWSVGNRLLETTSGTQLGHMLGATVAAIAILPKAIYRGIQYAREGKLQEAIDQGFIVVSGAGYVTLVYSNVMNPQSNPAPGATPVLAWRDFNEMCIPIGPECFSSNGTCMVIRA